MLDFIFARTAKKQATLSTGFVMPERARCVQCGICSYNCPAGIDVRYSAIRGQPIHESSCLTCGECVQRCPRGVLRFEYSDPLEELNHTGGN
jgi:NAD-dependent dihydropyrimidine dehydrogenase PreA subunit